MSSRSARQLALNPSPPPPAPPRLLTRRELADFLNVDPNTVDRMVALGLPYLDASARVSRYRQMRFDRDAVIEWMKERRSNGGAA